MQPQTMLPTQLRFASSLGKLTPSTENTWIKRKVKARSKRSKLAHDTNDSTDVILSSEMETWLQSTFEDVDEEGFLKEALGSVLTRPLDSMAIFCPTASIISSKTAAAKIPSTYGTLTLSSTKISTKRSLADDLDFNESTMNNDVELPFPATAAATAPPPQFSEAVDCLEVMWLKRRAQLEEEDGDPVAALKTLDAALEIHLGTDDYSKAKLADPVVASDPVDLMAQIEEIYVPYDVTPHSAAERIQRLYRKFYGRRCAAGTMISKHYRGHFYRNIYMQRQNLRAQCAFFIQKRYRSHLRRMIRRANQIKSWYKLRCQIHDYHTRLFYYRMARRIQRLIRGVFGRRKAYIVKLRFVSAMRIQRNARGYMLRRHRLFALSLFHRRLYWAARRIQKRFRIMNAIRHAQSQLIGESVAEEERKEQENKIYEESIRIELDKLRLYLKTDAGKLHLQDSAETIKARDSVFNSIKSTLPAEDIMARDATIAFELFDSDGSGEIDVEELGAMLQQLSISMTRQELESLAAEMDADGSGDIDFAEFLSWYTGGGSASTGGGLGNALFKQMLRARSLVMELTGVTLAKRAERDVLRQCSAWTSRDTVAMYRLKNPPKFSCCQCQQPFVLFSDYFDHFEDGICPETSAKALYYPDFSDQQDWTYQRMIEHELVRERDELPCMEYASTMSIFQDMALQLDPNFKVVVQNYSRAAKLMFIEKMREQNGKPVSEHIVETADISGEGILYPYIAKTAGKLLHQSLPVEWRADDAWELDAFSSWIGNIYTQKPEEDAGCLSKVKRYVKKSQLEADAATVGNLYFTFLRLVTVSTEAQLGALMELRKKRPRSMTIPDDILDSLELSNLTRRSYNNRRQQLIHRLKSLHFKMQELIILSLQPKPPCCSLFSKKSSTDYAPVNPADLSEAAFRELRVLDAHNGASARLRGFLHSRVGKSQVSRMASELWARQQTILAMYEESHSAIGKNACEIRYKYEQLASAVTSQGIEIYDADLFQKLFSLKIKKNEMSVLFDALNASSSGFIELDDLLNWFMQDKHLVYHSDLQSFLNAFDYCFKYIIYRVYHGHAKLKLLAKFRKMSRLEIELHHLTIARYIEAAETDSVVDVSRSVDAKKDVEVARQVSPQIVDGSVLGSVPLDNESNSAPATADVEHMMEVNLATLNTESKRAEERVLYRITEDDAETQARKRFFSRLGRYQITHEKMLLAASSAMVEAYGYCIPPSSSIPKSLPQIPLHSVPDEPSYQGQSISNELSNHEQNSEEESFEQEVIPDNEYSVHDNSVINESSVQEQNVCDDSIIQQEEKSVHNDEPSNHEQSIRDESLKPIANEENDAISASADSPNNPLLEPGSLESVSYTQGNDSSVVESTSIANQSTSHISVSWKLAISILIYTFDTDCSGTFDESEVNLLLKFLLSGLPERKLLFEFPEVNHDSATLERLVEYLVTKAYWIRGIPDIFTRIRKLSVMTFSRHISSTMLLISQNRQAARELATQAIATQTGESLSDDDQKNDDAMIIRSQIFAMRQVSLFLNTTHGSVAVAVQLQEVKRLFKEYVIDTHYSKLGLLQYAFYIHSDVNGMLVTELPHIVRFVVTRLKMIPNEQFDQIAEVMNEVKNRTDLKIMHRSEVVSLLDHCFEDPALDGKEANTFFSRNMKKLNIASFKKRDAISSVYSKGRQQAVLIAMGFADIHVAETNYRCCILGMAAVKKKTLLSKLWRGLTKGEVGFDKSINWLEVPREATMLLLLSRGFTMTDMALDRIQNVIGSAHHANGSLCDDLVDVEQVVFWSRRQEAMSMSWLQSFHRWCRWPFGFLRYFEYKRTVAVISYHKKEITSIGAMYLKEIVTGTSHCGNAEFIENKII